VKNQMARPVKILESQFHPFELSHRWFAIGMDDKSSRTPDDLW
jgi:hypothetical protein